MGAIQTCAIADTLTTLDKLAAGRWIDPQTRDDMKAAYEFLRTVEHRLQMVNDEQTQVLPAERDDLEHFGRFLGFANRDAFAKTLLEHLDNVQRHYGKLFETEKTISQASRPCCFQRVSTTEKRSIVLARLASTPHSRRLLQFVFGFAAAIDHSKATLLGVILRDLLPTLARTAFARTKDPDDGLAVISIRFLSNLHAAAQVVIVIAAKARPDRARCAGMLGIAPRLADTLSHYPQVMDALVDPSFFGPLQDASALALRLDTALAQSRHDEDLLERVRMFGLEYMFLIGVRILSGTVTARQAGEAFARLVDAVIRAIHHMVADNFAGTYGRLQDGQMAVLAMGKLGGFEMTATSDLDLILIYDFESDRQDRTASGHCMVRSISPASPSA